MHVIWAWCSSVHPWSVGHYLKIKASWMVSVLIISISRLISFRVESPFSEFLLPHVVHKLYKWKMKRVFPSSIFRWTRDIAAGFQFRSSMAAYHLYCIRMSLSKKHNKNMLFPSRGSDPPPPFLSKSSFPCFLTISCNCLLAELLYFHAVFIIRVAPCTSHLGYCGLLRQLSML